MIFVDACVIFLGVSECRGGRRFRPIWGPPGGPGRTSKYIVFASRVPPKPPEDQGPCGKVLGKGLKRAVKGHVRRRERPRKKSETGSSCGQKATWRRPCRCVRNTRRAAPYEFIGFGWAFISQTPGVLRGDLFRLGS